MWSLRTAGLVATLTSGRGAQQQIDVVRVRHSCYGEDVIFFLHPTHSTIIAQFLPPSGGALAHLAFSGADCSLVFWRYTTSATDGIATFQPLENW